LRHCGSPRVGQVRRQIGTAQGFAARPPKLAIQIGDKRLGRDKGASSTLERIAAPMQDALRAHGKVRPWLVGVGRWVKQAAMAVAAERYEERDRTLLVRDGFTVVI
jgi:hypothetical protein